MARRKKNMNTLEDDKVVDTYLDESNEAAYDAVIPAPIRYDNRLTPNAKIIYAEIRALCKKQGYCWARNGHFVKYLDMSIESVGRWVRQLEELGHIHRIILKSEGNKRLIFIDKDKYKQFLKEHPIVKNDYSQKQPELSSKITIPIVKNDVSLKGINIKTNKTTNSNDPPLSPLRRGKGVKEKNKFNSNEEYKKLYDDLREGVYREELFQCYDNLSDLGKPTEWLVGELVDRAVDNLLQYRERTLRKNKNPITSDNALSLKTSALKHIPIGEVDKISNKARKRDFLVGVVASAAARTVAELITPKDIVRHTAAS